MRRLVWTFGGEVSMAGLSVFYAPISGACLGRPWWLERVVCSGHGGVA
ncbi:MAG: hypothetical protein ACYDHP_01835 [Ferrimicrobium sp.]